MPVAFLPQTHSAPLPLLSRSPYTTAKIAPAPQPKPLHHRQDHRQRFLSEFIAVSL